MDISWMFVWFLVGLVVFQVRGVKRIFGDISNLYSILVLIPFFLGFLYRTYTLTPNVFIGYIGSVIVGFLSSLAYLIGANISRYVQFRQMSPWILYYTALFFMLWMILEALF